MSKKRLRAALVACFAVALIGAGAASAHQTLVNNGVAVTLHVTPNDEPVAGEVAQLLVPRVKTRTGKFSWATCRCTIKVSDSAKNVLLNTPATPRTEFTFPEAAAYKIEVAGRVLRKGKWATFKVAFAIRAF
jgi:hypothetical protein